VPKRHGYGVTGLPGAARLFAPGPYGGALARSGFGGLGDP
jgi:hypothetical protein